jgi:molecular chaperone DnaJ
LAGKRDYYEVLGIDRNADEAEIKRAFRALAMKVHPDKNPGDREAEDRFKEANEAYIVLSDPKARARYDRWGQAGVDGRKGPVPQGFGAVVDAVDELLGDFLKRRRDRKRGHDLRYTLEVSFEEAALGCEKTISVPAPEGVGTPRDFQVAVPPGTRTGAVRMLKGEGEPGRIGAAPGDLHVIVRVRDHPVFSREGYDVWCEVPITVPQAALGAVIEVPTLDGKVKMRVPDGTQSHRVFRVRGKGIPRTTSRQGPRGDGLVRVLVEIPTGLTARQRDLLEQFAQESGNEVAHPQKMGFLDQLRALFVE